MSPTLLTTLAVACLAASAAKAAPADAIDAHRWKSRILVVVSPDGDPRLAEQRRFYQASAREARERDLVLVEGVGASAKADTLRRRFGIAAGEFRAILVGKDGGAKLASANPIPAETLFGEIDRMPMRQDEARRRGASR